MAELLFTHTDLAAVATIVTEQAVAPALTFALDEMRDQIRRTLYERTEDAVRIEAALQITGAAVSAGYLAWLLRVGPLAASMLTTLPAWSRFDPLPVLMSKQQEKPLALSGEVGDDDDEQERQVERFFSDAGAQKDGD